MSALHASYKLELSPLRNSIKKSGFVRWRYVFNAQNRDTGEKASFFIELYIINPSLSPDEVVWTDLHAIPEFKDESQLFLPQEEPSLHSYVSLRVGKYGFGEEVVQKFLPSSSFTLNSKSMDIAEGIFHLGGDDLSGTMREDGKNASWRLKVERLCHFFPGRMQKDMYWGSPAIRAMFSGEMRFCSETYEVVPGSSFGFVDKLWGKDYPYPFFHLSCSHLSSSITGKPLVKASFVVQGIYNNSFALYSEIGDIKLARPRVKNNPNFGCVAMDNKLHWTVSVAYRQYLLDIDVFCDSREMAIRSYICPSNAKSELQVLGGSSGTGELRLYRRIKKRNLELIEHATLHDVRCEFGGQDRAEEA